MSQSKWVRVGSVRRFDHVRLDRRQARKVVDEAARAYLTWEDWCDLQCEDDGLLADLLDECADVIQATLNLVAALGVEDFRPYMDACERRNRERGRITN